MERHPLFCDTDRHEWSFRSLSLFKQHCRNPVFCRRKQAYHFCDTAPINVTSNGTLTSGYVFNTVSGADFDAITAADAFLRVHHGAIVSYMDCIVQTSLFAFFTGDAAHFTHPIGLSAFLTVAAQHHSLPPERGELNQIFGAGPNAAGASAAKRWVDGGQPVLDGNGAVFAGPHTIA